METFTGGHGALLMCSSLRDRSWWLW